MQMQGLDEADFTPPTPSWSSHLHLQHLVEDGLGQAFSDVSLVLSLGQPVSVLLVRDNASAPGDLRMVASASEQLLFQVSKCNNGWLWCQKCFK